MELLERIEEILEDDKKIGVAFTGDNSSGKTYFMERCINKIKEDYKIIYIPENCQGLNTKDYIEKDTKVKFGNSKGIKLRDLDKAFEERLETHQRFDQEATEIPQLLAKNYPEELETFFEEELGLKLNLTKDPMQISINGSEESRLTSSGYKAMIRIVSEIYLYLNEDRDMEEEVVIFLDEIDAKFYWNNREKYFKKLEGFIRDTFDEKKITFIISTHMSETIANLPEGYSIMKVIETKDEEIEYKEYMSNDFMNQEQVERIIFDKKTEIFKESLALQELKELYTCILEGDFSEDEDVISYSSDKEAKYYDFDNSIVIEQEGDKLIDAIYGELSIKEKVFFNSIKELMEW